MAATFNKQYMLLAVRSSRVLTEVRLTDLLMICVTDMTKHAYVT